VHALFSGFALATASAGLQKSPACKHAGAVVPRADHGTA
jgi:hypothetical protein